MAQPPPFPDGNEVPAVEVMADLLAKTLPEDGRQEGRQILAEQVLPRALSEMADHPKPRALAQVVYEKVGARLAESDDPGATLREVAVEEEIDDLLRRSLALAIARYAKDHPDAEETARAWLVDAADRYLSMSVEDIAQTAGRALEELDRVEARAQDYPEAWEGHRVDAAHARLNFQSARSGSFGTSAGALRDFLSEVGESPQDFTIH